MDKRSIALIAAAGGLVVGVVGSSVLHHAQAAAPANMVCMTDDPVQDAKVDAIVKQLHAHDNDKYIPQKVYPIGELPKPPPPAPKKDSAQ